MRCFIGYDPKAPVAYQVASFSVFRRASRPVAIHPLVLDQLPIARRGLTEFTFSRFLVPFLCGLEGWALWMDSDILCATDIHQIMQYANPDAAVMAVDTKPEFERSAVMLFNCAHPDNAVLTPEYIERAKALHLLNWTENAGAIPHEWNFLVGYDAVEPVLDQGGEPNLPYLIHYTKGLPVWPETADCDFGNLWLSEARAMRGITSTWQEFMGASVHKVAAE